MLKSVNTQVERNARGCINQGVVYQQVINASCKFALDRLVLEHTTLASRVDHVDTASCPMIDKQLNRSLVALYEVI